MPEYRPVTDSLVAELSRVCGQEGVSREPRLLARCSRDQVSEPEYAHEPEVVVRPASTEQVAALMRLASEERVPVTPRGAGSGLSGGAVPLFGGICLATDRMNRILSIDTANRIAVVEPGVVTNHLDGALAPHGLFFAGYPLSEEICFIGGNVAENAGGGRAVKYGVTGTWVTGLETVTPSGEVLTLGGKRTKDVTGYDLLHLMVGSEGTLGVFTRVLLRLLPRPQARAALLALFRELASGAGMAQAVMEEGLQPSAVELVDGASLAETCRWTGEQLPYREAGAMVIVEVDGRRRSTVEEDLRAAEALCRRRGAFFLRTATEPEEVEGIWKLRKQVPWALKRLTRHQSIEDISVPVAAVPEALQILRSLEQKHGVRIPCFGHAGDGNLHAHPLKGPGQSAERWRRTRGELLTELYSRVARLGGTISGEHGIGHKRKGYMSLVMPQAQIELMRGIKHALDPLGILNPGKIF